ncbi:exodeoxyribonuclease I [Buchnera aphidicola (Ceratovacuna keduensis)]|uniref:exodeoxyribonuclease I n=1 Tax=Buchnera aphidicola TaxID=9 RepID=UPI0031B84AE1
MLLKNFYFIFYDYETFGTRSSIDKPFQFSCVITDFDLNIISSDICFFCIPPIDYLPNIDSIFITKISPLDLLKKKCLNEYFFARKINKIFIKKNTCIVGYNNFSFDDEFTRNIFYRNFFDPYSWHWKNNSSRLDILIMLRAYYSFRPENIIWPKKNKKKNISFKLIDFTKKNNIFYKKAHNAIYDVHATISVTKFLKRKNKRLFYYILKMRFKKNVLSIINRNVWKPIFFSSSIFKTENFNLSTVLFLFIHPKNSNIAVMFDLSKNVKYLIYYIYKKKCLNLKINKLFLFGILFIYINRSPVIAPLSVFRKEDFTRFKINLEKKNDKISYIRSKWNFFLLLKNFFLKEKKENKKKKIDVDMKIYESFFCESDKNIMKKIHNVNIEKVLKKKFLFHDYRMNKLFFRFKARNFINTLNYLEKKKWKKHCLKIINYKFLNKYIENLKKKLKENCFNKINVSLIKKVFIYIKYIVNILKNY